MFYQLAEITNEIVDSVTTEATYGFTNVHILIFILLTVVTCSITFFAYLLYKYLHCFGGGPRHHYENIPEQERRWYLLADEVFRRSECVIGKRAHVIVRLLPDIKISEQGVFEWLGPVAYDGMILVINTLYQHGGLLVVPKEIRKGSLVAAKRSVVKGN